MLPANEASCDTEHTFTVLGPISGDEYMLRIYAGDLRYGPNVISNGVLMPIAKDAAILAVYRQGNLTTRSALLRASYVQVPSGALEMFDQHVREHAQRLLEDMVDVIDRGGTVPDLSSIIL
jgi:hypothetical protein